MSTQDSLIEEYLLTTELLLYIRVGLYIPFVVTIP